MTAPSTRPTRIPSLGFALLIFAGAHSMTACAHSPNTPITAGQLLPINGTRMFVKEIGSGEPVIVIHGGPVLDHSYLLPYLEPLASTHRLVFYDQRLCGRSSPQPGTKPVRIKTFVEDIEELRKSLKLGKVHLLAHSWGGLLAMHYAISHPGNLASLMLLDSMSASSALGRKENVALAKRGNADDTAAIKALRGTDEFKRRDPAAIEKMLLLSFRSQFHDRSKMKSLRFYIPEDYSERSSAFGAIMPDITNYDLHPALESVRVPSLAMYGSAEPSREFGGEQIRDRLPNCEFVVIQDAGHFPFVEQPETCLAALRAFLNRHPR